MPPWNRRALQALSLRAQSEAAALARVRCQDCQIVSPAPVADMLGCPVRCGVAISVATTQWTQLSPVDAAGLASALNCARLGLVFHGGASRGAVLVGDALLARALRNAVRHGGCDGAAVLARAVEHGAGGSVSDGACRAWEEPWCDLFRLAGADMDATLRRAARGQAPTRAYLASIGVVEDCIV